MSSIHTIDNYFLGLSDQSMQAIKTAAHYNEKFKPVDHIDISLNIHKHKPLSQSNSSIYL